MRTLLFLIIILFTLSTGALGQGQSKRKFNGILIGSDQYKLSPLKMKYRQQFKRKSSDSTVYSFEFQDVTFEVETEMLIVKDQVFIATFFRPGGFEKLMDFGLASGERWTVYQLFCFASAEITFERKYFDKIATDTLYQFKVDGQGKCSHSDEVTRIYGSKTLGLVRLDYLLYPNYYYQSIFVSSDYLRRGKLISSYRDGLLKGPR